MSCYFRHLQELFEESGIEVRSDNKKELDRFLHRYVGVEYKDCPSAWKELKDILQEGGEPRARLVEALKKRSGISGS